MHQSISLFQSLRVGIESAPHNSIAFLLAIISASVTPIWSALLSQSAPTHSVDTTLESGAAHFHAPLLSIGLLLTNTPESWDKTKLCEKRNLPTCIPYDRGLLRFSP